MRFKGGFAAVLHAKNSINFAEACIQCRQHHLYRPCFWIAFEILNNFYGFGQIFFTNGSLQFKNIVLFAYADIIFNIIFGNIFFTL